MSPFLPLDAQRRCAEDVALYGDSVPVPHRHLGDRFDPLLDEQCGSGNARKPHDGCLVICDVHCIRYVPHQLKLLQNDVSVCGLGRSDLSRDREVAGVEDFLEIAARLQSTTSSILTLFRGPPEPAMDQSLGG